MDLEKVKREFQEATAKDGNVHMANVARWCVPILIAEVECLRAEVEQLQVQLAGCSCAALGHGEIANRGDYGWSASYQDVCTLRAEVERLRVEADQRMVKIAELSIRVLAMRSERDRLQGEVDYWRKERDAGYCHIKS